MPDNEKTFLNKEGVKTLAEEIFKKVNELIDQRIIKTTTTEDSHDNHDNQDNQDTLIDTTEESEENTSKKE